MIDRGGPLTPRQRAKERAVVLALRAGLGALVRLDGAVYAYRADGTSRLVSYTPRRERAWFVALEAVEAMGAPSVSDRCPSGPAALTTATPSDD